MKRFIISVVKTFFFIGFFGRFEFNRSLDKGGL